MISKSNVHGPATFLQASGYVLPGYPSMGSWISYALGSEAVGEQAPGVHVGAVGEVPGQTTFHTRTPSS